jgi:hypothetical protein
VSQESRGRRLGDVFSVRITPAQREELEKLQRADVGPHALGPWLVWRALQRSTARADRVGTTGKRPRHGTEAPAVHRRVILDLCGGSGAWSAPYKKAGYDVRLVTLPGSDVRTFQPPARVWGVLAAPPCTEFSLAKNGTPRDLVAGLELVLACMRIVATSAPQWWALENPVGLLGHYLGEPRDVFQPSDFADAWTKRTALWGRFTLPKRRYVRPTSRMRGKTKAARSVTPSGFAHAFFEANP